MASIKKRKSNKCTSKIIKDSYEQKKEIEKKNETILSTFKKNEEKKKLKTKNVVACENLTFSINGVRAFSLFFFLIFLVFYSQQFFIFRSNFKIQNLSYQRLPIFLYLLIILKMRIVKTFAQNLQVLLKKI